MGRISLFAILSMLLPAALGQTPDLPVEHPEVAQMKILVPPFEPLWKPPTKALQGWIVGVDPVPPTAPSPWGAEDPGVLVAGHLYHMLIEGGGAPVLTRADAAPPHASAGDVCSRLAAVRDEKCDLALSLACGADAIPGADPVTGDADDVRLANVLGAALGAAAAPAKAGGSTDRGDGIPQVRAHLNVPAELRGPALRQHCRALARKIYEGLADYATQQTAKPELEEDLVPTPEYPTSRIERRMTRLARTIWPEGKLPAERLGWFISTYARLSFTNQSLVFFDVRAEKSGNGFVLRGRTNTPLLLDGLTLALAGVGIAPVSSEVQALPDPALGAQRFAVTRVAAALTYGKPGRRGPLQTELLYGEPLLLLAKEGQDYLLHAADGYVGWVHAGAVQPLTAAQYAAYVELPRVIALRDLTVGDAAIPRGAVLRQVRSAGDEVTIRTPEGGELTLPADACRAVTGEPPGNTLVSAALELLYSPYIFGGRGPEGLDCSGLVTNVSNRVGLRPPRDAWQQALGGRLVATRWYRDELRAGDQLFFINLAGKVYHTAIAIDARRYVHSSPPCVQINSFDPQDPLYNERLDRDFFVAKRP